MTKIATALHVREQDVRDNARLRGRPRQAAGAQPIQERPIRQPARTAPEKNLPALLVGALNEKVVVTIDGERREITKREAVVTQMVNESARANLPATKMLIDMLKDVEKKAGVTPPPEPAPFTAADEEVMRPSSLGCGNRGGRNFNKEARGTG